MEDFEIGAVEIDSELIGQDLDSIDPYAEFTEVEDWNLKCYDHYSGRLLFFYLTNVEYTFYSLCTDCNNDGGLKRFGNGEFTNIYDFD